MRVPSQVQFLRCNDEQGCERYWNSAGLAVLAIGASLVALGAARSLLHPYRVARPHRLRGISPPLKTLLRPASGMVMTSSTGSMSHLLPNAGLNGEVISQSEYSQSECRPRVLWPERRGCV